MIDRDDFRWFKHTFRRPLAAALAGSPFTIDLLAAIAAQETGEIWARLRDHLPLNELLEICVGDTLDADKGRRAFPQTRDDLLAAPEGETMFRIAHEALVRMAAHVPAFAAAARRPGKFCRGYGIFQYDLQFFRTDPQYFLQRRWRTFDASLEKCLQELRAAMRRAGLGGREQLSDLEQVHVAIAYNAGSFRPSKGLRQGHFDGERFYGEKILAFLRLSQTALTEPEPGSAALPLPERVTPTGVTLEVNVETAQLRLRSEPRIDSARPSANVIAHLPDGHRVRLLAGRLSDKFVEVETSLRGALLRGFAAARFLERIADDAAIPVALPDASAPESGVVAVHAPRKSGVVTRRTAAASALSLSEPDQPSRNGTRPEELRTALLAIIDYLAVDKASHARYQPRSGVTFCNIYAHDYCHLARVYLPRVWWTPDALERLSNGERVTPRLGATVDEQRANDLFRWLRAFGLRFGWRQTGSLTALQTEVNLGAVGLIIARRKIEGRSGHVSMVVPETPTDGARRNGAAEVIAPLQSQAGVRNFRYGCGAANWWNGEQFSESAFWLHP